MTSATREQFAAAVRADPPDLALACLLIGAEVEPDLAVEPSLRRLDELASVLPAAGGDLERLRLGLGVQEGFGGTGADYLDLRSSLLHEVLRRRRGLPILLSVVWLEVARRAGIAAYGVGLPGHFVVGVGDPAGPHAFCDPFTRGRAVERPELESLVRDTAGVPLAPEHLAPAAADEIVLRVLTNIRAHAARTGAGLEGARTQLWAVELSLLLPRHPLDLRRQRGELLVRLGEFLAGAAELEAYADVVGEAAEPARRAARMARARCN